MLKFVITLLLLLSCSPILVDKAFPIQQLKYSQGWKLLSMMWITSQDTTLQIKTKLITKYIQPRSYQLQIELMGTKEWQKQTSKHCSINKSTNNHIIPLLLKQQNQFVAAWTGKIDWQQQQYVYIVMRDCKSTLINQFFQDKVVLQLYVSILSDQSHLSNEQQIQGIFIALQIIITLYIFLQIYSNVNDQHKYSQTVKFLLCTVCTHFIAIVIEAIVHFHNHYYGNHSVFIKYISVGLLAISQACLMLLFLKLSYGWTIYNNDIKMLTSGITQTISFLIRIVIIQTVFYREQILYELSSMLLYIVVLDIPLLLNILIQNKMHFASNIKTLNKIFYRKLLLLVLFQMTVPVFIYLISNLFSVHVRWQVLDSLFKLCHTFALLFSIDLLGKKRCIYQKITLDNKSFMD